MDKIDEDIVRRLIHSIGLKYGLQDKVINNIVNSPYKFTREIMTSLQLDNITEEEFDELKVNFIYRYLGKIYTQYDRIERIQKQSEKLKEHNKEIKWKSKEI